MDTAESPVSQASEAFVAEFTRWRVERGLSKKQLAAAMGFDPSYVSHVEARRHRPTEDFARRAEMVLQAGGAIWRRFKEYDGLRASSRSRTAGVPSRDPPVPEQWLPPGTGLLVEQEQASLTYADGAYLCRIRRELYNAGTEPVTRYLIRISVDRYPGQPERSNRHYHEHPLTWDELSLTATCGGSPMRWQAKTDKDSFKEVWLLFENDRARFPLYPGHRTTIDYTYRVGADKWGQWFQRAVRLPTRRLSVHLDFPAGLDPVVWGVETSLTTEAVPLRTPIQHRVVGDRSVYAWTTDSPPLHTRYRLEWWFRRQEPGAGRGGRERLAPGPALDVVPVQRSPRAAANGSSSARSPSERMRTAGIVQRGAEVLRTAARQLDLPAEETLARDVVARLFAALERVGQLHPFTKGMGLAAPQLGIGLAVAVVRPVEPHGQPVVLLNPRVVDAATELDEQFEGCLSFFDVRGRVGRPLWLAVEQARLDGVRTVERYDRAVARLVAHEIDHLHGRLYSDRMAPGARLVPVQEYEEAGRPWRY